MARPVLGCAGLVTAAALTAALVPLPAAPASSVDNAPQDSPRQAGGVDELAIPAAPAEGRTREVDARLARTRTDPYRMVAVTWAGTGPAPARVEVRTRGRDGWSGWRELEVDHDGPAHGRTGGTVPLWTDRADGVSVRVTGAEDGAPDQLRVATIDPADGPVDAPPESARAGDPMRPPAFPGRPALITRQQWGADPDLGGTCDKPIYGKTTKAAIIHHTAGTNTYSRADSAGIVRGILAYHTKSRKWCDIGYNFLVDRFGRVYEGRDGGVAKPVRGAHSGDFNVNTVGVSMMGTFAKKLPSKRMRNAVTRLVGWRLGTNYVRPKGRVKMHGKRIGRISGHRDVTSTACPGARGYRWLPGLRNRVVRRLSRFDSPIQKRRKKLGARRTGAVFVGERRVEGGRRTRFRKGVMYWKRSTGAHFVAKGPLLRAYNNRGGVRGRLGFPQRDSRQTKRGATVRFQHGALVYDKSTGKVKARYW